MIYQLFFQTVLNIENNTKLVNELQENNDLLREVITEQTAIRQSEEKLYTEILEKVAQNLGHDEDLFLWGDNFNQVPARNKTLNLEPKFNEPIDIKGATPKSIRIAATQCPSIDLTNNNSIAKNQKNTIEKSNCGRKHNHPFGGITSITTKPAENKLKLGTKEASVDINNDMRDELLPQWLISQALNRNRLYDSCEDSEQNRNYLGCVPESKTISTNTKTLTSTLGVNTMFVGMSSIGIMTEKLRESPKCPAESSTETHLDVLYRKNTKDPDIGNKHHT